MWSLGNGTSPPSSRSARRPAAAALSAVVAVLATGGCADGGLAIGVRDLASASFCEQVGAIRDLALDLDLDVTGDPSSRLSEGVAALDDAVEAAPDAIRADLAAIRDQARLVAETFGSLDPDDPSSLAELTELLSEVDLAEVQAASVRVGAYVQEHCGVELDPTDEDGEEGN